MTKNGVKFPYYPMESSEDIELMNRAIQKVLEETRIKDISDSADKLSENNNDQLLPGLLSQLESLKEDNTLKQYEPKELNSGRGDDDEADAKGKNGSGSGGIGVEELVKELKEIKRQNSITHFLVSGMIVVTLIWQVSEASIALKVSNGVTHPFKSLGSWVVNKLKSPIKQQHDQLMEATSGSGLSVQIPELPNAEFPHLGTSGEGH